MKRTVVCPECAAETETRVPPGKSVRCGCGARVRVPLRAAGGGSEFDCPECGARTRSGAAPGQRTTCRACGVKVRVPLRSVEEAEEEAEEVSAPVVRRGCPECGARVPGALLRCTECDAFMESSPQTELEDQRAGGVWLGWVLVVVGGVGSAWGFWDGKVPLRAVACFVGGVLLLQLWGSGWSRRRR